MKTRGTIIAITRRRYYCDAYNIWLPTSIPVIEFILFATFACRILGRIVAELLISVQAIT